MKPKASTSPTKSAPRSHWVALATHTHLFSGDLRPPQSYRNLVQWTAARGIDAIGVGSPFTPKTAKLYGYYENVQRGLYYSGDFDQQSVKHPEEPVRAIATLNRLSRGRTLFYLDNETPKARYGHLWWVGWHHDFPEWHDYDQPFDRWMTRMQKPGNHLPEPMPYQRRPYMEIVATQRAKGALAFWAHPTSWWRTDKGAFVTNICSEMPAQLAAEGYIDGLAIMGYDAYRPSYLELWHHLLDLGYPVLGLAEIDKGLSAQKLWEMPDIFLSHIYLPGQRRDVPALVAGLKRGRVYASSGPVIEITVDGHPMGSIAPTAVGRQHLVKIRVSEAGRVELLGAKSKVLWRRDNLPAGTYSITVPGRDQAGYLLARMFGPGDLPEQKAAREIRQFAVTNPVYLHPRGHQFPAPMTTALTLDFDAQSPYLGGQVRLEQPTGALLEQQKIRIGSLRVTVPANSRVTCVSVDGWRETQYLINANRRVMALQQYLYRGQFLLDHPKLAWGEVPAAAFNIAGFRRALASLRLRV
jgi:hypothetical protein